MFTILSKDYADVDRSLFEQVGICSNDVVAALCTDQLLSIKGMPLSELDFVSDYQHSMWVSFDYEPGAEHYFCFTPHSVYQYDGEDFIELEYQHRLGLLNISVFFLVRHDDCVLGVTNEENMDPIRVMTLAELWDHGFVEAIR